MTRLKVCIEDLHNERDNIREELLKIPYADRNYNELCRILTKIKYHTDKDARDNTIKRASIFNKEKRCRDNLLKSANKLIEV